MVNLRNFTNRAEFDTYRTQARLQASAWARRTLEIPTENWLILDTETTGLGDDAEVIQVGLINGAGHVLMNNILCKPLVNIPPDAMAIHHITNEMVENAPNFFDVYKELASLVDGRGLIIYNKAYDMRLINQSLKHFSTPVPFTPARVECAMLRYAEYVGNWNENYQNFKWPKLEGGDHSALGDCRATLEIIKKMAKG